MKKIIFLSAIAIISLKSFSQNVAINTTGTTAHSSAMLDISSNSKGILIPRVTTAERQNISSPANGLLVFDVTTNSFWYFSTLWKEINPAGGGSGFVLPYNGSYSDPEKIFSIINTNVAEGVAVHGEAMGGIAGIGILGISRNANYLTDTLGAVTGFDYAYGTAVFGKSLHGSGVQGVAHDDYTAGVRGVNTGSGNGLFGQGGTQGSGIFSIAAHTTGKAAWFDMQNKVNASDAVLITNDGLGASLDIKNTNSSNNVTMVRVTKSGTADYMVLEDGSGNNKIRFSNTGKGFFNGGTQTGGADLAEAFDVSGNRAAYEPGDVLVISIDKDRTVERSSSPYSALVAGVYATQPGVLMTEENIDTDISDKVPMGVVGVIPTKVCTEGGEIKRGDLLVSSSTQGVAMKADIEKIKPGQVIGKALENYSAKGIGKVKVLVGLK